MSKIMCDHCHLEYEKGILISDHGKYFCCKGCQGVYHLLKDEGLDNFYTKMGNNTIVPPKDRNDDINRFDLDGFIKKYVNQKDGFSEISLIIEGIHCAACVWLNEKVLTQTEGIVGVNINHTNNKAKVVWDAENIKLSQIIQTIRSIGYNAYPYDAKLQEQRANAVRKDYYARLLVGVFVTMNIMWIAIAQYSGYFTGMSKDVKSILNFAEFILATPVLFYTGAVFFKGAYYGLKNRFVNMDLLVVSGAVSAYLFSIYAMFSGRGEVYFESVAMIITFVFVGKYLEVLTKKKAVDTMDSFSSSIPSEVLVVKDGQKTLIEVESVQVGDIVEIKSGEKVVIDGLVISGEGSFDYSSLTGESKELLLKKDDKVQSGSICLDSVLRYCATNTYTSSFLYKIASILENAMDKKPHIEKIANQISGYFSNIILALSVLTFLGWFFYTHSFEHSLIVAISVIVIACPCALGLATPVATLIGISRSAKKGVLFKEATFLEAIAQCTTIIFDKTGTLTQGKPQVVSSHIEKDFNLNILYSLVSLSSHPISKGIKEFLELKDLEILELEDVKTIRAKGVKAKYKGKEIIIGNKLFLSEFGFTCRSWNDEVSHLYVAYKDKLVASFGLLDTLRSGAKDCVEFFQNNGLKIIILSGDNKEIVSKIAKEVGVKDYEAELMPDEKASYILKLREKGEKVIMVGDGINDTLALAQSEVAITLGSGTDVALSVSDVVLLNDDLKVLQTVLRVSKNTFKRVKQNLILSFLYNAITIPLAMAGYVIPLIAALSMSISSLIVIGNSLRKNSD